jgi:hypothetical protein
MIFYLRWLGLKKQNKITGAGYKNLNGDLSRNIVDIN